MGDAEQQDDFEAALDEMMHDSLCRVDSGGEGPCDCGFDALKARLRAARFPEVTTIVDEDLERLYDMAQPPELREMGFALWDRDLKWRWDIICDRIKRATWLPKVTDEALEEALHGRCGHSQVPHYCGVSCEWRARRIRNLLAAARAEHGYSREEVAAIVRKALADDRWIEDGDVYVDFVISEYDAEQEKGQP